MQYLFAFVSNGYYVKHKSRGHWQGVASGLSSALYSESSSNVVAVSGGPKGEYFLRSRSDTYSSGLPDGVPEDEVVFAAFGPGGTCFAKLRTRHVWKNVPKELTDKINTIGVSRIDTLSIGADGSWALTYDHGKWSTHNVASALSTKLHSVSGVRNIVLSHQDKSYWFFEDTNGGYHYWLPKDWKESADNVLN